MTPRVMLSLLGYPLHRKCTDKNMNQEVKDGAKIPEKNMQIEYLTEL